MTVSIQAVKGTESNKTVRLMGYLANQNAYMLVDSGSTTSFISQQLASHISGHSALEQPVQVKVANGNTLPCTHELPDQVWGV